MSVAVASVDGLSGTMARGHRFVLGFSSVAESVRVVEYTDGRVASVSKWRPGCEMSDGERYVEAVWSSGWTFADTVAMVRKFERKHTTNEVSLVPLVKRERPVREHRFDTGRSLVTVDTRVFEYADGHMATVDTQRPGCPVLDGGHRRVVEHEGVTFPELVGMVRRVVGSNITGETYADVVGL
jgi:hypothetical protein